MGARVGGATPASSSNMSKPPISKLKSDVFFCCSGSAAGSFFSFLGVALLPPLLPPLHSFFFFSLLLRLIFRASSSFSALRTRIRLGLAPPRSGRMDTPGRWPRPDDVITPGFI